MASPTTGASCAIDIESTAPSKSKQLESDQIQADAKRDRATWLQAALFWTGFFFVIPWVVGATLGCCRPHRRGPWWVANTVMTSVLLTAAFIAAIAVPAALSHRSTQYYAYGPGSSQYRSQYTPSSSSTFFYSSHYDSGRYNAPPGGSYNPPAANGRLSPTLTSPTAPVRSAPTVFSAPSYSSRSSPSSSSSSSSRRG